MRPCLISLSIIHDYRRISGIPVQYCTFLIYCGKADRLLQQPRVPDHVRGRALPCMELLQWLLATAARLLLLLLLLIRSRDSDQEY